MSGQRKADRFLQGSFWRCTENSLKQFSLIYSVKRVMTWECFAVSLYLLQEQHKFKFTPNCQLLVPSSISTTSSLWCNQFGMQHWNLLKLYKQLIISAILFLQTNSIVQEQVPFVTITMVPCFVHYYWPKMLMTCIINSPTQNLCAFSKIILH